MLDIFTQINALKRPKLLVRAARFGLDDYQRTKNLRRVLRTDETLGAAAALIRLLEVEREANQQRLSDDGAYSIGHHVEVLIAIMGEAQLLRATKLAALET